MGILNWLKIVKNKKIHEAILEIAVNTHSPFCPIWRIFLPVYHRPSKKASWIFLFFAILNHMTSHKSNFEVRIRLSFFSSELSLPTSSGLNNSENVRNLCFVLFVLHYKRIQLQLQKSRHPYSRNTDTFFTKYY